MYHHLKLPLTALLMLAVAIPAFAVHPDSKQEVENLKKRIEVLENNQESGGEDLTAKISEYLSLNGVVEVEASYTNPNAGKPESDLALATAELSFEATLNENVGGHLILFYENGIDLDEGVISLTASNPIFGQTPSLHVGRAYLPFGVYNSYMISDPLTLELGETRSDVLVAALESELWTLKIGAFNGSVDNIADKAKIDSLVAALDVTPVENLTFGVSYLSDLAESGNELVAAPYRKSVEGVSAYVTAHCDEFGIEAEYLTALQAFDAAVVGLPGRDLTGERPAAFNLELAWMPSDKLQIAARYERANDFQNNIRRYGATASYGLFDNTVVALEFLRADADVAAAVPLYTTTAQLALEF